MSNLILHETAALGASRQEMIQWALGHYGLRVSRRALQGSIVPSGLAHALRPSTLIKRFQRRSQYQRLSSTFSSHPTETLIHSESLESLISKEKKTKDNIQKIQTQLLQNRATASADTRREALVLLLRYKRVGWVREFLEDDCQTATDHALLLSALALQHHYTEIEQRLSKATRAEKEKLLSISVHHLTTTIARPKFALQLWLTVVSTLYPNLKVVHQHSSSHCIQILLVILGKIERPTDIIDIASTFIPKAQQVNFFHTLSYAYYMLMRPHSITQVWENIAPEFRNSSLFNNTIRAYTSLHQYRKAVELFWANGKLVNKLSEREILAAITAMEYKGPAHDVLIMLMEKNSVPTWKVCRILETLLHNKRLREFDQVLDLYRKHTETLTRRVHNIILKRALHERQSDKFYDSLRELYSSNEKPNTKTFRLLFEQFAKQGQVNDGMSLLQVLIQRQQKVTVQHFTALVQACEKAHDNYQLTRLLNTMRALKIEPDRKFTNALMSLQLSFKNHDQVEKLYIQQGSPSHDVTALHILMKSYLMERKYDEASRVYKKLTRRGHNLTPTICLARLEYLTHRGDFFQAVKLMQLMKERGVPLDSRHYHVMMRGYNRHKIYDEVVTLFELAIADGKPIDSVIYRELLFSFVKVGIINERNFTNPINAVRDVLQNYKNSRLSLTGELRWKSVQPVVKALVKFYKPQEAYKLMDEYRHTVDGFDPYGNLNFMRQEMMLFASQGKWGSFETVFQSFQDTIKEHLNEDGQAPLKLKKVYNSVIKPIHRYFWVKRDPKGFATMFDDLLFVHRFTFDSKRLNWVARELIRTPFTLHYGLKIVELKLMGGKIAQILANTERVLARRAGISQRLTYRGRTRKPNLMLGYYREKQLFTILYNHILNGARKRKISVMSMAHEFEQKYPLMMRNVHGLMKRLKKKHKHNLEKLESKKKKETQE